MYEGEYDHKKVALKQFDGGGLTEKMAREIHNEADVMMRLDHECLIRLLGLVYGFDGDIN